MIYSMMRLCLTTIIFTILISSEPFHFWLRDGWRGVSSGVTLLWWHPMPPTPLAMPLCYDVLKLSETFITPWLVWLAFIYQQKNKKYMACTCLGVCVCENTCHSNGTPGATVVDRVDYMNNSHWRRSSQTSSSTLIPGMQAWDDGWWQMQNKKCA